MAKEKSRQWDGKSRPSTDLYKKRFDEIFNKKKEEEQLEEDDQEYLNKLKDKL